MSARVPEALIGAGIGGLSLAGLSALMHEPKKPLEWIDENDRFRTRNMTESEKRERTRKLVAMALLGASIGGAGSVGASHVRRLALKASELEALPIIKKERLTGLQNLVNEAAQEADKAQVVSGSEEAARRIAKRNKAQALYAEQESKLSELANAAASERDKALWGGLRLKGGGKTPVPHEKLTLEGQVERYYRDLQKAHDLPPMISPYDRGAIGEQFFKKLLEKRAVSNALFDELLAIEKVANLTQPYLERVRSAALSLVGQASSSDRGAT